MGQGGERPIRVLVAKAGLDGHDRGAKVIAAALRDAGMEVVYTGLRASVPAIAAAAEQEAVDVIGLSVLSGAHLSLCEKLLAELGRRGLDVPVVVGGVVPPEDVARLRELGVRAVFGPELPLDEVVVRVRGIAGAAGGEIGQAALGEEGRGRRGMTSFELGELPELGVVPKRMKAVVIRPERLGDPITAMQVEEVPPPPLGPNEVLVLVMAAGVNFNGVWAARGRPISVFKMHGDDFHIPGSDAAGIVWKVGQNVRRWRVGDEVVVHCNQSCGECPECNGLDPLACGEQKIWGYETNWGSFAQLTRVQSQQLLRRPPRMSWQQAASYGLTYFTAYRMLVEKAGVTAGDWVLVWGAAGGLGIFAVQLCRVLGANAVGMVSSPKKGELVMRLGARGYLDRTEFDIAPAPNETAEQERRRLAEVKRLGTEIRRITGGRDVDVVFEHVGRDTFAASVFLAKRFGKVVICGATSGYQLGFDVRHLWMRQKSILGSHFSNAYQAERANELVHDGRIATVVDQVFPFEATAQAHAVMAANRHAGKLVVNVQAPMEALAGVSQRPDDGPGCSTGASAG
ncbi:MAG: crotonyl-CoA carboxylase/reductase [Myxococcales bacterium]|nr:crotonyl-CoA carboxylase/reductase [Myxococcales bacterium]